MTRKLPTARRTGPGPVREWSAASEHVEGKGRLFVVVDPDDLAMVEIDDTLVGHDGRPIRGGSTGRLVLSAAEVRWLAAVLPEAATYLEVSLELMKKKGLEP